MACLVQNNSSVECSSGASLLPLHGDHGILDPDTLQYIHKFYCKDCCMEKQTADDTTAQGGDSSPTPPKSPASKADTIQMINNKESLKRKLMLRRSVTELVNQGIYPSLKTPPAFAEQRKHLERAKTGDLLKHKIQSRPDRRSLVQQNILEDTHIDPSLQVRERLLKRARVLDNLNEKLSHRPGPLELIQGNILQTDEQLVKAINDGTIVFSRTSEGEDITNKAHRHFIYDEESISDGPVSPSEETNLSDLGSPGSVLPSPSDLNNLLTTQPFSPQNSLQFTTTASVTTSFPQSTNVIVAQPSSTKHTGGGKSTSRHKKSKLKALQAKSKVIKFHEYKGPPNAPLKSPEQLDAQSSYNILLTQQQKLLKWQLEEGHMSSSSQQATPDTLTTQFSVTTSNSDMSDINSVSSTMVTPSSILFSQSSPTPAILPSQSPTQKTPSTKSEGKKTTSAHTKTSSTKTTSNNGNTSTPNKIPSSLEEMKVADLKIELKKRNLPVSGSKPHLIERLKPHWHAAITTVSTSPGATISSPSESSTKTTLPSIANLKALFNIPRPHTTGTFEEPVVPTSPNMSTKMPFSPESMDVQGENSMSQYSIATTDPVPMYIEQLSRPSSRLSTENLMDVDQLNAQSSNIDFTSRMQQLQHNQQQQNLSFKPFATVSPQQHHQPMQTQSGNMKSSMDAPTPPPPPPLPPPKDPPPASNRRKSHIQESLIKKQLRQIQELERQLEQSQLQLKAQKDKQLLAEKQMKEQILQFKEQEILRQQQQQQQQTAMPNTGQTIQISILNGAKGQLPQQIQIPLQLLQGGNQAPVIQLMQPTTNGNPHNTLVINNSDVLPKQQVDSAKQLGQPSVMKGSNHFIAPAPLGANIGQPMVLKPDAKVDNSLFNGINRTVSVPLTHDTRGSPIKPNLSRTASSPFLSLHTKDPPKYDEAIKTKLTTTTASSIIDALKSAENGPHPVVTSPNKSQAMDDVLEILMRNGELPASLLQEMNTKQMRLLPSLQSHAMDGASATVNSVCKPVTFTSILGPPVKREMDTPPPPVLTASTTPIKNVSDDIDLEDGIPSSLDLDFTNMDWTSDTNMELGMSDGGGMGLGGLSTTSGNKLIDCDTLPYTQMSDAPIMSSDDLNSPEPMLNTKQSSLQIADWLDVIIPSTGHTPLSTNAPIAFPSDPVLTPKTQQEVLYLFNFDEAEFSMPTLNSEPQGPLNWDRLGETSMSKS